MGVALGRVRQIKVDDMGDADAVDAARRDVRGDHDPVFAAAKAVQGLLPAILGEVALQGCREHPFELQLAGQTLGPMLGAGEDEHAVMRGLAQKGFEQGHLLPGGDRVKGVLDLFRRSRVGDLHHCGLHQDLIGYLADFRRHGRGEKQVLPFGRQFGHDPAQIGQEAHVEHAVGFVEDQGVHMGQVHQAPIDEVKQTSGTGHQHA